MSERPDELHGDELGEVDEAELREAERLALAIDGRDHSDAPRDALEAGLLLRVLNAEPLSEERARAIESDALGAVRLRPRRRALLWSSLSAALGLAALSVLVWSERAEPAAHLPTPPVELLAAQASALSGEVSREYPLELSAYRREVWRAARSGSEPQP